MKKKLQVLALTLILGVSGAVWAGHDGAPAADDAVAVAAAVTASTQEFSLEEIFGPMFPSAGSCWTGHTAYSGGSTLCQNTCYSKGCGFDYWVSSTCTCYCGTMF